MAAEDGSNGGDMDGRHSTFIASLFHEFVRQKTGDLVVFVAELTFLIPFYKMIYENFFAFCTAPSNKNVSVMPS